MRLGKFPGRPRLSGAAVYAIAVLVTIGTVHTARAQTPPPFLFVATGGFTVSEPLSSGGAVLRSHTYTSPLCASSFLFDVDNFSIQMTSTPRSTSAVFRAHGPGRILNNTHSSPIQVYALGVSGSVRVTSTYQWAVAASLPANVSANATAWAVSAIVHVGNFSEQPVQVQDSGTVTQTLEGATREDRVITCFGREYFLVSEHGVVLGVDVAAPATGDAMVQLDIEATRLGDDPPNRPPTASFSFMPDPAFVGEQATFDASSSSDADGAIVRYRWDFGDGTVIDGDQHAVVVRHTYAAAGDWPVVLTVEDDDGGSSVAHRTVAVEPAKCTLPQGGLVVREQIAPPASGVISCGPPGVKRVVWGSFGEAEFLESDRGERLQLACVGATGSVPYFKLTYQSRPGADPVTVGACPWEGGCNTVLFFHPGDNESTPSGKPDCLLSTIFLSKDYGRHNDEFTAYPENPWTEARDLTENHLDWAVSSFDVNERSLTKWDHKFDYADSIVADIFTRNVSPPLSCGVRNENGGPTSTRPVRSTLVDPPVGPETEAFFSRVLDVLQAGPGQNAPMVLSGVAVCDFDSDGACGPADLNLMVTARESCANQPDFHPAADVDADGCVGATDQALAFADAQIVRAVADVYPGDTPDIVDLASKGVIPVALLGSTAIDVRQVDPTSAVFGRRSAVETHGRGHLEDVNADGRPDLVLHFRTSDAGVRCGDSRAVLTAATFSGALVEAAGSIITTGCIP